MTSTTKREYQLAFKQEPISAEDKIVMLNNLLAGQCKQTEKINYLTDRAEVYCDQYLWTDVLRDITEIELLIGNQLNRRQRALKTKASVQLDLQKVRQFIGNAVGTGVDHKEQFDVLMSYLDEQNIARIFEDKNQYRVKKSKHS